MRKIIKCGIPALFGVSVWGMSGVWSIGLLVFTLTFCFALWIDYMERTGA